MQEDREGREDLQSQFLYEYQAQVADLPLVASKVLKKATAARLEGSSKTATLRRQSHPVNSWLKAAQMIQQQISSGYATGIDALLRGGLPSGDDIAACLTSSPSHSHQANLDISPCLYLRLRKS